MATPSYLTDAYLREKGLAVVRREADRFEFDDTIFCPTGGGQPHDTGRLTTPSGGSWAVVDVTKEDGRVVHRVEGPGTLEPGDAVSAVLDWPRRYAHMRYHTLLHILSGVVYRRFQAGISGGQIASDRARMDFSLPEFNPVLASELLREVNEVVEQDREVAVRFVDRQEAAKDPTLFRVATELVPDVATVRLIDIRGFDVQADGGTHVARTSEVGPARLLKIENKGSHNKRMYLGLPASAPPGPG